MVSERAVKGNRLQDGNTTDYFLKNTADVFPRTLVIGHHAFQAFRSGPFLYLMWESPFGPRHIGSTFADWPPLASVARWRADARAAALSSCGDPAVAAAPAMDKGVRAMLELLASTARDRKRKRKKAADPHWVIQPLDPLR